MNVITVITIAIVGTMTSAAVYLIHRHRKKLSNLQGSIIAITIALMTGLYSGYLLGVTSEDLFLASGTGMLIGFFAGFLAGQPAGILAILSSAPAGLISGIVGAMFSITMKTENPFLMLTILLIFYVMILGFVILFILVETGDKYKIDTLGMSPFTILAAGIVVLSLFLFLYSSDVVKVTNTTSAQAQFNDNTIDSNTNVTEVDVTNAAAPIVRMEVTPTGYVPNVIRVKKGVTVKLVIHNTLEDSCLSTLLMPDFNLNKVNLKMGTTNLSFTPTKKGQYTFTCGMKMYKGFIIVE